MGIINSLGSILSHPLNRNKKHTALIRWAKWQLGSRLVPGPVAVPFVNHSKLLVFQGMTGATGNVYSGLHEFEEMAFVLHVLRPDDLFLDVGANIGSYTVLAGSVIGAKCIAFEPVPDTFAHLVENINLNDIWAQVTPMNMALGREEGSLKFTSGLDTMNHVISQNDSSQGAEIQVSVSTLDKIACHLEPTLIKIDVEGYETEVITGGQKILTKDSLLGVIMELNGSSIRYGYDEAGLHQEMVKFGFALFRYIPFTRELFPVKYQERVSGNSLYLKNNEKVKALLSSAPPFSVLNHRI